MYLAYDDEAGDDGYPKYSSPLFVLTACYVHYLNWKETYNAIHEFRRGLKSVYHIPVGMEFHCKHFLLNKDPFRKFNFSGEDRAEMMRLLCQHISGLNVEFINVAIIKPRIVKQDDEVLDMAFRFSIQRIENTLGPIQQPANRFMIITDPGRIGKREAPRGEFRESIMYRQNLTDERPEFSFKDGKSTASSQWWREHPVLM
jgi:hypothetical protein